MAPPTIGMEIVQASSAVPRRAYEEHERVVKRETNSSVPRLIRPWEGLLDLFIDPECLEIDLDESERSDY